ncbi:AAA family ATPase [Caldimonas thermodepolymerans]|uniref:Peptidoglycan-binding protein n=1 Tax=Caldimonas thermodepolymerans TaxID=215580 RepID=A0A2S5T6W5_9BURK|nr:AAA family ATPase [Caldimonas thermodepolymerans]PPE70672.1 peptidoglycan-binding protein [Caldimonas thermodepolymerans]QPC33241.1 AAA family ATPase [Caldimonas thermodepolymerans]RDH97564.1 type II secretion system protein A [Caldimonas thermodepolymerans]UZG42689.1 AAA family ATPase [Caldimonas thermodepolymerans]
MYAKFFGLKQEPFSIAPDPRYLFMSERHREALAHLLYGVRGGGGFVLLSGEIGAGKTTVCRCFLEKIPKRCNVAYIFNPKLTVEELLQAVCEEFRIPLPEGGQRALTVKDYVDRLNEFLLRTHAVGQNNVLIIDEAQNLSADVLEQLRLLTNLETSERKLLQIILIGQPELRTMLARPELEQLAQRVVARFHLDALSEAETEQYIRHRLAVAGMERPVPFDRGALRRIHELSRGVPRRINLLCDRALLGAYASGRSRVDERIVEQAAREVFGAPRKTASRPVRRMVAVGAVGVVAGAALMAAIGYAMRGTGKPVAAIAAAAPAPVASAASAGLAPRASAPAVPAAAARPQEDLPPRGTFKALIPDEQEAWRQLAAAWQLQLGPRGDACQAAQRQGVHCYRTARSTLAQIRLLDRPGILTLDDGSRDGGRVLLTRLTAEEAVLRVGDIAHTVPLSALAQVWRGDFATFWRAPAGYDNKAVSDRGPVAEWLAQQLAKVPGLPSEGPLRARIQAFQLAEGLEADGLAGPVTFMQLNRVIGVDEPRLQGVH